MSDTADRIGAEKYRLKIPGMTLDDYLFMQRHVVGTATRPSARRRSLQVAVITLVVLIALDLFGRWIEFHSAVVISARSGGEDYVYDTTLSLVLLAAFVVSFAALVIYGGSRQAQILRIFHERSKTGHEPHDLVLGENGIAVVRPDMMMALCWESVTSLRPAPNGWLLTVDFASGIVIPQDAFESASGSFDYLSQRLGGRTLNQRPA